MSTTFHPQLRDDDLLGFDITCLSGDHADLVEFDTYLEATAFYEAALTTDAVDQMCCGISPRWAVPDEFNVGYSHTHATTVLDALGYTGDDGTVEWGGQCTASDFKGRILIASALGSDIELPAVESVGARGARIIDCGRAEGYFAQRYARLVALADWCEANGRDICWD